MEVDTTRFGPVEIEAEDIIRFPEGLLGLPECRQWVFLADARSEAIAWMQSTGSTFPAASWSRCGFRILRRPRCWPS